MQITSPTSTLERVNCGVCGSDKSTHLFEARDHIYGNEGSWPVAQCDGCGVVFMNPRIPPSLIGPFYPKSYYTNQAKENATSKWKAQARAILLRKKFGYPVTIPIGLIGRLAALLIGPVWSRLAWFQHNIGFVSNGIVLDAGCGNGGVLSIYRNLGWRTFGNEIGPESAALARKAGHDIFVGELQEARYAADSFDAVTLWDALEHIHNPAETMAEVFRVCRSGGQVYVYVPNFGSAYARRYRDKWFMFTAPLHYYHYTAETLTALLQRSGFNVLEMKYPLGAVGLLPTLTANARAGSSWTLLTLRLAGFVLRAIERLLPRGHLLAIARKPSGDTRHA